MKNKKIVILIIGFIIISIISIVIIIMNNNKNKFSSFEDEVKSYTKDLNNKYGDISIDIVYAYCNSEEQHILICYYGTGSNYDKYGNTYIMYSISKDGKVEISDPNEDISSLSKDLLNVIYYSWIEEYHNYKDSKKSITYEEFKNFNEG